MTMLGTLKGLFTRTYASSAPGPIADAASGADRFTVRRKQRMRHGFVSWPARPAFPAQVCDVIDASFNGACIELSGALPDSGSWASGVRLYLVAENHEFNCQVAWQRGTQVGLRFQGHPQPPSQVYR